jgi:hypothetical protein
MRLSRNLPVLALAGTALAAAFEPAPTFKASQILPADILKGPHHTVDEKVTAEGFYQEFTITTTYGPMEADGRTELRRRVREIGALAQLDETSKTEVFAKAAGGAVLNVGKGFASAVKDPGATAKGIGAGVKRFGVNLGRKSKRAAESATADKPADPNDTRSGAEKTGDAAGSAALSIVGVNGSARKWAQKLGVDPYTTNKQLHDALVSIGKIDTAGSIATKIVLPIPAVVSTTATVGGLVWGKDPEEVRKINEARLTEIGAAKDDAAAFLKNQNYTLTNQTRFIGALHAVKAKGCADYVSAAAEAATEREALFFVESAEMLQGLHEKSPVSAVLEDSRALTARTGSAAVVLLPLDYLRWTERLSNSAQEIAGRAKTELGATSLEIRLSGQASAAAKDGVKAAGWTVTEGVSAGLMTKPAD